MLVQAVDFAVAIPVQVFVVSREQVAFLIDVVTPDVFPRLIASDTFVSELNSLVAVSKVVVSPSVVGIAVRALAISLKVLPACDGGDALKRVGEVAHLISVGDFKLQTQIPVAIQVLYRSARSDYRRKGR